MQNSNIDTNGIHVIEICGLPNTYKTHLAHRLAAFLSKEKVKHLLVPEYRGGEVFYEKAKKTPLVTLARSQHSISNIILKAGRKENIVMIFDRGSWDSIVWSRWFTIKDKLPDYMDDICINNYKLARSLSRRYDIVLTNDKFENSVERNGFPGSIVNMKSMKSLSECYAKAYEEYRDDSSFISADSCIKSSRLILTEIIDIIKQKQN